MTALPPWFERSFPGGYPAELLPSLVSRLRGAVARVRAEVAATPPERLTVARDGDWSPQRHVGHLIDLEALWLARLDDLDRGEPVFTAADVTNRRTHEADHDTRPITRLVEGFAQVRAELVGRVEGWDRGACERTARHPRLDQPMRAIDLLLFVAEHDDHHLARLTELRR
jgi:uncharacterized damage-inducible protein DinB